MSDVAAINQVLAQMQALKAQAVGAPVATPAPPMAGPDFNHVLHDTLESINQVQQNAAQAVNAFERGDPGADLASAMIASQKASLSFRAATEVRNRFVRAYQDIMNMPI